MAKVTNEDFKKMKEAIEAKLQEHGKEHVINNYEIGLFPRSEKVKDLQIRFMWDLYWASGCGQLTWGSYKDTHITTALRKICPVVTKRY